MRTDGGALALLPPSTSSRLIRSERRDVRLRALVAALVLHTLGVMALDRWVPEREPSHEEPIVLSLMATGNTDAEADALAAEDEVVEEAPVTTPSPTPPQPQPTPRPTPVMPAAIEAPPVKEAPMGTAPMSQPTPAPPTSFAQWQRSRFNRFSAPRATGTTRDPRGAIGPDRATSRGVQRCEPDVSVRADIVYLLFDSSGSMSRWRKDLAVSCAQQYAKASLDRGARVAVANFADATSVTLPSHDLTTVGAALRDTSQGNGTRLPTSELRELFATQGTGRAELVIVSDGYLPNVQQALPWYQYFLETNPDNRGYLYTIRQGGAADVTQAFTGIGFRVLIYDVL